ncbi:MAG: AAA family ATPase [Bacteroidetes bacterium]|nr:AAA family ATPase [Bacteroidota bacterium]
MRVILKKLVFEGSGKKPAILDFKPGFNVITGPSDTGKSMIFSCLTYVLGGTAKPKQPPEASGYTNLFLTLIHNGAEITIERSILSNDANVYNVSYEQVKSVKPTVLSGNANAKNSLSDYLLDLFGLAGKKLKKNESNEVISLTFNVLKNLILISEGKIQDEISPVFSGVTTSETSDKSLFRFILTGVDYSNIIAEMKPAIRKADANARINILKQLIDENSVNVDAGVSIANLRDQKQKLEASIENEVTKISDSQAEIENLQLERKQVWEVAIKAESNEDQRTEILKRFNLLASHYQTDLDRLDASIEAGNLLIVSKDLDCPLCGAKAEFHRPDCVIDEKELIAVRASCEIEKGKINSLQADLKSTIDQVNEEYNEFKRVRLENERQYKVIDTLLTNKLEPSLNLLKKNLREMYEKITSIDITIEKKEKIVQMEKLMASAKGDLKPKPKKEKVEAGVQAAEINGLLKEIEKNLKAWHYPNVDRIGFSETQQDITIGAKNRSDQGKGYRALSCAGLVISLMEFCIDNDKPYPGFTVLDSPLVTFRGSDKSINSSESVPDETKRNFYLSLSKLKKDRQVIILENDEPPTEIIPDINYIHFTKESGNGRFGFIPI